MNHPDDDEPRVIIVDDHADFRFLVRSSLEGRGCVVTGEAPDGRAAVQLATTVACDRIVMDYRMPVMDGVSATELILQHDPSIEIVAFTDSGEITQDFFDAGATAYYAKSQFPDLIDHIARPLAPRASGGPAGDPAAGRRPAS